MNARRDFLKSSSALVLGFSLAPELALTQGAAPLPGSLNTNRSLDGWPIYDELSDLLACLLHNAVDR